MTNQLDRPTHYGDPEALTGPILIPTPTGESLIRRFWMQTLALLVVIVVSIGVPFSFELQHESKERAASLHFGNAVSGPQWCAKQLFTQVRLWPNASSEMERKLGAALVMGVVHGNFGPPVQIAPGQPTDSLLASRGIVREVTGSGWRGTHIDKTGDEDIAAIEQSQFFQDCHTDYVREAAAFTSASAGWTSDTSFDEHLVARYTPIEPSIYVSGLDAYTLMKDGPFIRTLYLYYSCVGPPTGPHDDNCNP